MAAGKLTLRQNQLPSCLSPSVRNSILLRSAGSSHAEIERGGCCCTMKAALVPQLGCCGSSARIELVLKLVDRRPQSCFDGGGGGSAGEDRGDWLAR